MTTLRLRLLTRVQVKDLDDSGLHDVLVNKCGDALRDSITTTEAFVSGEAGFAHLDEAVRALADCLKKVDPLVSDVREALDVGGMRIDDEDAMLELLALWAIERQLDDRLLWDPDTKVRARKRGWFKRLLR